MHVLLNKCLTIGASLFQCMWRKEAIPQEFKVSSIIQLYKRKGNLQVFDKHSGIFLLLIAKTIQTNVLLNDLNVHLDQAGLKQEKQCLTSGFL